MLLGPIVDAPVEEWDRMVDLNVTACCRARTPRCRTCSGRRGRPRGVADLVNVVRRRPGWPAAAASTTSPSTGSARSARRLRQEVTERHVRVSLVEPGAVATELADPHAPGGPERA